MKGNIFQDTLNEINDNIISRKSAEDIMLDSLSSEISKSIDEEIMGKLNKIFIDTKLEEGILKVDVSYVPKTVEEQITLPIKISPSIDIHE